MRSIVVKKESPLKRLYMLPPFIKVLLALFLFLLIDIVGFIYIHHSSNTTFNKIDQQQKAVEKTAVDEAKKYAEITALSYRATNDAKLYHTLVKRFPPKSKVESLLENITKLGMTEGLKFVYFKPQQLVSRDFYVELPVDVAVLGQYHQIGKFLSGIANLPDSVVAVNHFFLSSTKTGPGELLTFQFTATIYYADQSTMSEKS